MNELFLKFGKRYLELEMNLLHGGYKGGFLDLECSNILIDEILLHLGLKEYNEELKQALLTMFLIGQISENKGKQL